jgi:hypothetical protein
MANTKQISVRMPIDMVDSISRLGAKSAAYVLEAVRDKLQRDKEAEIAEGLKCLADDSDADDFSALAAAQAKVIARVD